MNNYRVELDVPSPDEDTPPINDVKMYFPSKNDGSARTIARSLGIKLNCFVHLWRQVKENDWMMLGEFYR